MPKLGMEPIRRAALVKATIAEIGTAGSLDVTVAQIARRAGMSSALAHHYFGSKDQIFLAAMRQVLADYGAGVRAALAGAEGHEPRLHGLIVASFAGPNFRPEVISAWLNFYALAQSAPEAKRLLTIYHRRMRSNLAFDLRPLIGARAAGAAGRLGALIDGLYLRHGLRPEGPDAEEAAADVLEALRQELRERV